jgi:hypothetical protein
MASIGYVEAIGMHWPEVQCYATGPLYSDLVWVTGDPLPTKEELDAWIEEITTGSGSTDLGTKITVLAFRNRFTIAEKIQMDLMSIDNPNASIEQRQTSAAIRVILRDLDNAVYVDLARDDTLGGVTLMQNCGILTAERGNKILTDPVKFIEIPLVPVI